MEEITFRLVLDWETYFNANKYWSFGDDYSLFMLTGGRGIGKTTGLAAKSVLEYMKNGTEFVYVRRYITELRKAKSLLDPIINKVKTVGRGNGAVQWEVDKKRIGYGVALTAQQSLKSGFDFSNVNILIYDEAILPRGGSYRYLSNEVEMFLELCSTVFRDRKGYKIFILGNNADMFNPYHAYFNIPKFETTFKNKARGIYCELAKNSPKLLKKEQETPLFKLTQGTAYADYHYNNKVLTFESGRIGEKNPNAELICRFVYNTITLNIYRQSFKEIFVELREKVIKDNSTYIIMEDDKPNYLYITAYRKSEIKKLIDICYFNSNCIFDGLHAVTLFDYIQEEL